MTPRPSPIAGAAGPVLLWRPARSAAGVARIPAGVSSQDSGGANAARLLARRAGLCVAARRGGGHG